MGLVYEPNNFPEVGGYRACQAAYRRLPFRVACLIVYRRINKLSIFRLFIPESVVPPGGIEPPSPVPKTDTLSVKLQGRNGSGSAASVKLQGPVSILLLDRLLWSLLLFRA